MVCLQERSAPVETATTVQVREILSEAQVSMTMSEITEEPVRSSITVRKHHHFKVIDSFARNQNGELLSTSSDNKFGSRTRTNQTLFFYVFVCQFTCYS